MFQFFQILLASSQLNEVCQSHGALLAAASADKHFLQRHLESLREKMKGPSRETGKRGATLCGLPQAVVG